MLRNPLVAQLLLQTLFAVSYAIVLFSLDHHALPEFEVADIKKEKTRKIALLLCYHIFYELT